MNVIRGNRNILIALNFSSFRNSQVSALVVVLVPAPQISYTMIEFILLYLKSLSEQFSKHQERSAQRNKENGTKVWKEGVSRKFYHKKSKEKRESEKERHLSNSKEDHKAPTNRELG